MTDTLAEVRPIEHQPPESSGIPESWLKAYVEGNKFIPQMSPGINIFVLAAVLEEPPESWVSFGSSHLSDVQVSEIGKRMTDAHRGHHVPQAATGLVRGLEKAVPDERTRDLWSKPRLRIMNLLKDYVDDIRKETGEYVRGQDLSGQDLDEYFASEQGASDLEDLKVAALGARDVFRTREARDHVLVYREILLSSYVREPELRYDSGKLGERHRRVEALHGMVKDKLLQDEPDNSIANSAVLSLI